MNASKTVSEFLAFLQPDSRFLLVAIYPNTGDITAESFTDYPQAEAWALDWNGKGWNAYYTINLAKPMGRRKASKRDMVGARAFWADIDPDIKFYGSYSAARDHLLNGVLSELCGAQPTLIIDSGHGLQPLWALRHPTGLASGYKDYETLNAKMGAKFHGPGTFNCDRILRLPFTKNYPNAVKLAKGYPDNPSMARIVDCTGVRYTEAEITRLCRSRLEEFLDSNPKARARWNGSTEGLSDTSGSAMDFSMVAMLKGEGFSEAEVKEALYIWPHGSRDARDRQRWDRYFERCWTRTSGSRPGHDGTLPDDGQERELETITRLAELSPEAYEASGGVKPRR